MTNKDFFDHLTGSYTSETPEEETFDPELMKASKTSEDVALNVKEASDEEAEGHLTIDVYEDGDTIVVESTVAGVESDDLDISINAESVSIQGERQRKEKVKEGDFLYQECFWGTFSRSVVLPEEIDPDKAKASLKNGVLKIVLPKLNKKENKKLKIKVD